MDTNYKALAGWVKSTFVNASLEYVRKHYRNSEVTSDYANAELNHFDINEAVSKMALEDLTALIHQLPEQCRRVFNLFVIDGYSHKIIAEKLEISIGTSKSHLHDARRILKVKIAKLETVLDPSLKR